MRDKITSIIRIAITAFIGTLLSFLTTHNLLPPGSEETFYQVGEALSVAIGIVVTYNVVLIMDKFLPWFLKYPASKKGDK
jgi:hypothetical protein